MINPYTILAGVAAFVISVTGAYLKGGHDTDLAWQVEAEKSKVSALQQEAIWKGKVDEINAQHKTEVGAVARQRDAALASLRNRAEVRLSGAAGTACAGATGRELSKPDAGFLVRLAAEADELRASLRACQSYITTITKEKS